MKYKKVQKHLLSKMADKEFENEVKRFEKFRIKVEEYNVKLGTEMFNRIYK
jgi:hypothetical protein